MRVILKAYHAINSNELCATYRKGHSAILEQFGISNVTTNNIKWKDDPFVYFILCFEADNPDPIAGVRIHIYNGKKYPPLCDAIGAMDDKVYDEFNKNDGKVRGELCGLWAHTKVLGLGFGRLMTHFGVLYAKSLGLDELFCITAQFNINMVHDLGFSEITSIGLDGFFSYPNDSYSANVLVIRLLGSYSNFSGISCLESIVSDLGPNERVYYNMTKGVYSVEYNFLNNYLVYKDKIQ